MAKHDADMTYEDVKAHALAEIESADEFHVEEWESADAELIAIRK
tara:strand:- start:145 stop:279 length:135 start_codon:yes stop_codon:yes gene_type:complete